MSGRFWEHPRVRAHLPFAAVCLVVLLGFLRVAMQHWREGAALLGCALLVAAALRGLLPGSRVGLLALRSRRIDIGLYGALGLVILYVATTIEGGPFG